MVETVIFFKRQLQILKLLIANEEKVTSNGLAEINEVSSRTIRYDLDAIQYYLEKNGLDLV